MHADKFLAFKTPLSDQYDVPDESLFSPTMLLTLSCRPPHKLGLIIDLTKTDRFYDKKEVLDSDVAHYKLKCEGYVCVYVLSFVCVSVLIGALVYTSIEARLRRASLLQR